MGQVLERGHRCVDRTDTSRPASSVDLSKLRFDEHTEAGGLSVSILGEIYGETADSVLSRFAERGHSTLREYDGSFLLSVVDHHRRITHLITDPIGTRAAYLWDLPDGPAVTNTLRAGRSGAVGLDAAGIGSYISNDGAKAGLTPFAGVRSIDGGTHMQFGSEVASVRYWTGAAEPAPGDRDELGRQLLELFRRSVRKRIAEHDPDTVTLSLSGGADSRGLLGLLCELIGPESIDTFTYYNGAQLGDMDLPIAQEVAKKVGVRHRLVRGYAGDVITTLLDNAIHGDAMAHFCDDADVWRAEKNESLGRLVIAGDRQSHNLKGAPDDLDLHTVARMVSLHPASTAEWFFSRLPVEAATAMTEGWDEKFERVLSDLDNVRPWRELIHEAYLDQRMKPTLTLWRERFCRQVGPVVSPFLDREVLDLVAQLPTPLNAVDGALLHRTVLQDAFPDLFGPALAHGGWNIPDWGRELAGSADEVRRLLFEVASPLDEMIPPDVISRLLDECVAMPVSLAKAAGGWKGNVRRVVKESAILTRLVRARNMRKRLRTPATASRGHVLRRVMTLRLALADHDQLLQFQEERIT